MDLEKQATSPNMRQYLFRQLCNISPFDDLEKQHLADALAWIESEPGSLFRIESPDIPPKHLVCYLVKIDPLHRKILLLEHIKADKLLPSGGHPDPTDKTLWEAVKRETWEEFGHDPISFFDKNTAPFFISQVITGGLTAGHTDVDLWFVLHGDSEDELTKGVDFEREYTGYHWYTFAEAKSLTPKQAEEHLARFITKLELAL